MLMFVIFAVFVLSLIAQAWWDEEWLFGTALVSGILGVLSIGLLPLIGHYEPSKTVMIDADSIEIAYDPMSDQTAYSFDDVDGNPMIVSVDAEGYDSKLKVGPEAKLVKICPEPYGAVSLWAWPDCNWELYVPSK